MSETLLSCQVWGPVLNLALQPPKLLRLSFFLFHIPPCLFSFARSASLPLLPLITFLLLLRLPPLLRFPPSSPSSSPPDLDVKAPQAVWSLSAGCQGRDTAHWDPEWDKLTVTMFPLSIWSWEKEEVKRRA